MKKLSPKFKAFAALSSILVGAFFLLNSPAYSKSKSKDSTLKVREAMVHISRQLGVTCAHCHDVDNLRSNKMRTHKIALEHIKLTQWLNKKGFKGKPKVDCYLCHRGKAIPDYREKLEDLKK